MQSVLRLICLWCAGFPTLSLVTTAMSNGPHLKATRALLNKGNTVLGEDPNACIYFVGNLQESTELCLSKLNAVVASVGTQAAIARTAKQGK